MPGQLYRCKEGKSYAVQVIVRFFKKSMIYLNYQYNLRLVWSVNVVAGAWRQRTRRRYYSSRFQVRFDNEYKQLHAQLNYTLRRGWQRYTSGPRTMIILGFMPDLGKTASDLNLGHLLPALLDRNVKIILVLSGFNAQIRKEYDYLISLGAPDPHPIRDSRIEFVVPETAKSYTVDNSVYSNSASKLSHMLMTSVKALSSIKAMVKDSNAVLVTSTNGDYDVALSAV
jgi:hypothetical protein